MQNAVLIRGLDALAVYVLGKREDALVIAVGVFVINLLVAGMIMSAASCADRQHPPPEGDVHRIGSDTRYLGEHEILSLVS